MLAARTQREDGKEVTRRCPSSATARTRANPEEEDEQGKAGPHRSAKENGLGSEVNGWVESNRKSRTQTLWRLDYNWTAEIDRAIGEVRTAH